MLLFKVKSDMPLKTWTKYFFPFFSPSLFEYILIGPRAGCGVPVSYQPVRRQWITWRAPTSYLEVEAYGRSCHQVVEMLVEIPAEDILGQGFVGVKRLLLYTHKIILESILTPMILYPYLVWWCLHTRSVSDSRSVSIQEIVVQGTNNLQ